METSYRPQTKLRKGNVFRNVCQEFCPQSGCTPPPPPPAETPTPGQIPPPHQRTVRILLECILVILYFL